MFKVDHTKGADDLEVQIEIALGKLSDLNWTIEQLMFEYEESSPERGRYLSAVSVISEAAQFLAQDMIEAMGCLARLHLDGDAA